MGEVRDFAASVIRNVNNIRGWSTPGKILVIESDDWGSIRVPSKAVYDQFRSKGFAVDRTQYNRLDALESNDDMMHLLEVLDRHRDHTGRPACITANVIMANPDFARIQADNFLVYHYEHFQKTLQRYPAHDRVFQLYREGMTRNLFHPQFHGREHLNIGRWMRDLRTGHPDIRYTFDAQTTYSGREDYNYMEALDMDERSDLNFLREVVKDGLHQFEQTFGFRSRSFIAPCYTWDPGLEETLHAEGIEFIQGGIHQYIPLGGFDNYESRRHVLGQRNGFGQVYLTRNCFFEPALVSKPDWVDYTLASIRDAFRWNKPAILCAHRINFVGYIDAHNRETNLALLDTLLGRIRSTWPTIEFMTSDQLGDRIKKDLPA